VKVFFSLDPPKKMLIKLIKNFAFLKYAVQ